MPIPAGLWAIVLGELGGMKTSHHVFTHNLYAWSCNGVNSAVTQGSFFPVELYAQAFLKGNIRE